MWENKGKAKGGKRVKGEGRVEDGERERKRVSGEGEGGKVKCGKIRVRKGGG